MTPLDRPDVEGRSSGMPVSPRVSILLVRPLADEAPRPADPEGVTLLVTHEIVPSPGGIRDARAFAPDGAILVVSSRTTVDVLAPSGLFAGPWRDVIAAGEETARALREAGAARVTAPDVPGAAGILALLPADLHGSRLLWPRGSDAAIEPHAVLAARGAAVASPVVYEKRPLARLDADVLARLASGGFDAVAVTSIAALDVLLAALPAPPPPAVWGVLGPETARLAIDRGLPAPLVPSRPRIPDLLALLQERAGESKR